MLDTITASETSTVVTATNEVSFLEIAFPSGGAGQVNVEYLVPGGEWEYLTTFSGATPMSTPDPLVQYRFQAVRVTGTARCYFGTATEVV